LLRAALFPLVSLVLVLWCALGVLAAIDVLATDCADAASEISDPCATGKATYLGLGFIFWLLLALPLFLAWLLSRPRRWR
jgi:hypothetical protein